MCTEAGVRDGTYQYDRSVSILSRARPVNVDLQALVVISPSSIITYNLLTLSHSLLLVSSYFVMRTTLQKALHRTVSVRPSVRPSTPSASHCTSWTFQMCDNVKISKTWICVFVRLMEEPHTIIGAALSSSVLIFSV